MGENSIKRCTSLIPSLLVKFGKCCGMYIIRKANESARTIVFSFRRRWKLCAVSHEPHLPKKKKEISPGVVCTVTHYTGLPRLMSCAGVTKKWRLLFHVKKNAVRWLALSKRLVEVASFPDPTQLSVACSMAAR